MSLYMVKQYKAKLVPEMMEQAIKTIKTRFQKSLAAELDLRRVTAPLFVLSGTGMNAAPRWCIRWPSGNE